MLIELWVYWIICKLSSKYDIDVYDVYDAIDIEYNGYVDISIISILV